MRVVLLVHFAKGVTLVGNSSHLPFIPRKSFEYMRKYNADAILTSGRSGVAALLCTHKLDPPYLNPGLYTIFFLLLSHISFSS